MLPYKCETCNQRFSVKWKLVHHQKTHEPEKEAISDESNSGSTPNPQKVILKNTEVLQDFNTHECPVCRLSFAGKKQLERHERVHGNKKFYQCDRCYLAFFWKSNYNRHRKQSCTRRVFQCEKCNRTFNKKFNFLHHKPCYYDKNPKPFDDDSDVQEVGQSISSQLDHFRDGPSTSKDQATEVDAVVPLYSIIKRKPRISKLKLSPTTSFQLNHAGDRPSTSNDREFDRDVDAYVPLSSTIKTKPRASKLKPSPSTSFPFDRTKDGPSTSKDEVDAVVPLIRSITGKPRASKLNLNNPEPDATESKSDEISEDEFSADPNFDPKMRKRRTKYGRKKQLGTKYEKKKIPRTNYDRKHTCDLCHLGFRFKCDLSRHRRTHDNVKPFPCDQCDLGFNWKSNLVRHQKRMHLAEKTYNCEICGEGFSKKYHLARHRANDHEKLDNGNDQKASLIGNKRSGSYDCNCDCGSDSNPVVIQLHPRKNEDVVKKPATLRKDHASNKRKQTFNSQDVNIVYLHACHDEVQPRNKNECNPERSREQSKFLGTQDVYNCDVNNGPRRRKIDQEGSNHEAPVSKRAKKGAKEFVCSVCSRVFTRKSAHLQHERSHYKQSLRCDLCHRTFARKSIFKKHRKICTSEKPFQCEICNCYFRQKSQLVQHFKSHSGLKPHECEVCKRKFNRKSVLVRHKKIHTGEKPFECEVCHLCFNQKSILVQHLKIHTGLKPYRCRKCNYSFTQKWNYRRHKQKHQISGRTFSIKCKTCDSNFPRKRVLIQQEKNNHRKKFVFHIYNTRTARESCSRKVEVKAKKHLDKSEEIYAQPSKENNSDGNRGRKTLPKVHPKKVIQVSDEIADLPDYCVPVNVYIQKDLHNRKSFIEDPKNNQKKIQNAKALENNQALEYEKKTNHEEISEGKKDVCTPLNFRIEEQMENSVITKDKLDVEDCNKCYKENQQMKEDVSLKEVSLMNECVDEPSGIKTNSPNEERQKDQRESKVHAEILNNSEKEAMGTCNKFCSNTEVKENNSISKIVECADETFGNKTKFLLTLERKEDQNDAMKSKTHAEILNNSEKRRMDSDDNPCSNTGVKETKSNPVIAVVLPKRFSENYESIETGVQYKDSSIDVEPQIQKEILSTNPTEEQQGQKTQENDGTKIPSVSVDNFDCQEARIVVGNTYKITGVKNCCEKVCADEYLDKPNHINQEDDDLGDIDAKNDKLFETFCKQKYKQDTTFPSNLNTHEKVLIQYNACIENSREYENTIENETIIQTQAPKFQYSIEDKSNENFQYFKENNDKRASEEILDVGNGTEKPNIQESSTLSKSSEQAIKNISNKISTNSGIELNVSDHALDRQVTYVTEKEITGCIRDLSTLAKTELPTMTQGAVENTKCYQNMARFEIKTQEEAHSIENLNNMDLEENCSYEQTDEIEFVNETWRVLEVNKSAKEIVDARGRKLHHKASRNKRRLKYRTDFGRKQMNFLEDSTNREEENVREALKFLKINDESTEIGKVTNDAKEEKISITRHVFIYQTKVIENIVEIKKTEDNVPHSTVDFNKARLIVCPAKPIMTQLEQAYDYKLKKIHLNNQKSGYKQLEEFRKNLATKTFYPKEKFALNAENIKDTISDTSFIQKYRENPFQKMLNDQKPGQSCGIDEELDEDHEFQNDILNKQTLHTLQKSETNVLKAYKEIVDRKQVLKVCEEIELQNEIQLDQETSTEIGKSNDLHLFENEGSFSLKRDEVERSDSALREIPVLQKQINGISDETNCEVSDKILNPPEISPNERQIVANNPLEAIDRNKKPIQCEEINDTLNLCKEIDSNENFAECRDVSSVIDLPAADNNQFNGTDQNNLEKNSSDDNSIHGHSENHVSSSGIGTDCDFTQNIQTLPEKLKISSETGMGSERRESAQNLHLFEKNCPDSFGFLDLSTLSSPVRWHDLRTKSELPPFSAIKSRDMGPDRDNSQNQRYQRNKSLDLMNKAKTHLEFSPLQNIHNERASTECGQGHLSFQDHSENFTTPDKNRNNQRAEVFEHERNSSNLVFSHEAHGGLKPQTYYEYIIPFENIYQHSTSVTPVSETVQSIPSYAEAFSRQRLALNDGNLVYTALYPEFSVNSHNYISGNDVGYIASSNTPSQNIIYDQHQYEDYMQNFCRDRSNSTPQDEENQTYSEGFRHQLMNSVENNFRNEEISKRNENTRNDSDIGFTYQVFTPQTYEEAYTFPTRCEESYNYSVHQEEIRTYAVHHAEANAIQDLARFEKTCIYPTSPTGISSREISKHYKESNAYECASSSDAAYSSYFRTNAPTYQDPVAVNVQSPEAASISQLYQEQGTKYSEEQLKTTVQSPQEHSRSSSMTNMSRDPPKLNVQLSPVLLKQNQQTPQGLFRLNTPTVRTPHSSWTNLQIPQGTSYRLPPPSPNTPIRLIKPSPQYPISHPQGIGQNMGPKSLTSPSSPFQNKNGLLQDQEWRRRMDFDRNRRIPFESPRATAGDYDNLKGIFIERHFRCDQCDHSFARKEDLIRHRFTAHEKFRVVKPVSYMYLQ